MFAGAEAIRRSLDALGAEIARSGREKICVLICGGSALSLSGLIERTTEDVDALGAAGGPMEIEPLPEWLFRCATEVAADLGMEENWLNDAASALQAWGLPEGMIERAQREKFGDKLEVAIASRKDLIALKCLAALDPKTGRKHLEDLVDLAPGLDELQFAGSWLLDRPTSRQFREAFHRLCLSLGHDSEGEVPWLEGR
jgi:hypothetical protein